jgi:AcrR family transcriptional regulator
VTKKNIRSRKEFVIAILALMAKKEYDTITISEICKTAGYNRGTFYQNFRDKDDLLNEIIESKLGEMVVTLRKVHQLYSDDFPMAEKVESLGLLFEFIKENAFFFKVVLTDNKIIGFRYKMFLAYRDYVRNSLKNPLISSTTDLELNDFYLMYVTSGALGVFIYWINEGLHKSPQYLAEQYLIIGFERPHDLILGKEPFRNPPAKENQQEIDPRILRTKQALKDALLILMKQKEYSMIKVSDITNLADYNRSTFYSHYQDKDQLYLEIISDFVEGLKGSFRIKNEHQEQSSPLYHLFSYAYSNHLLLEIMYSDKKVPGFFNFIYTELTDNLIEELKGRIDVDTEIYIHYLVSALMSIIGLWFTNKVKYSPSYLSELFTELLQKKPIRNEHYLTHQ